MAQRHGEDYGRHRGGERQQQTQFDRDRDRDREGDRERWTRYRNEQDDSDVRFGRNVGDIGGHGERYRGESRLGSTFEEEDESPRYYGTQRGGLGGGQLGGRGDFGRDDLRREFSERELGETEFDRTSFGRQREPRPYGGQQNYGGLGSSGGRDWYSGDDPYRQDRYGQRQYGQSRYGRGQYGSGSYGSQGPGSYGYDEYYDFQRYGRGMRDQSFRGRGPRGYERTDDRLREILCEMLTEDPAIDAGDIAVTVTSSIVTLDGTVMDRWTKYQVEELAENVSGVKEVRNQLRVDRDQGMGAAQSGMGSAQGGTGSAQGQRSGSQYSSESQLGSQSGLSGSTATSSGKDRESKPGKGGNA